LKGESGGRTGNTVVQVFEHGFQAALLRGVQDARNDGKGLLYYGGIYKEGAEGEEI
jgi:hypothetical protein